MFQKKKSVLIAIAGALAVAAVLSGCGNKAAANEAVSGALSALESQAETASSLAEQVTSDVASATSSSEGESSDQASENTTPAPDFTVIDGDGTEVKLSDMKGKPVVLNFWASWCPPCKGEMPDFDKVYAELGEEVTFMMVNMTDGGRETVDTAKQFIADSGYTFPVYFDTNMEAAMNYAVRSIPSTFYVDKDGNIVTYAVGAVTEDQLRSGIDAIR